MRMKHIIGQMKVETLRFHNMTGWIRPSRVLGGTPRPSDRMSDGRCLCSRDEPGLRHARPSRHRRPDSEGERERGGIVSRLFRPLLDRAIQETTARPARAVQRYRPSNLSDMLPAPADGRRSTGPRRRGAWKSVVHSGLNARAAAAPPPRY